MIEDALLVVTRVGMFLFVVAGMAAMGLSLTVSRIVEPLRDVRAVTLLLAANFVAVPVVAIATSRLLPMEDAASTAVVLVGCCAGAPFLPKLTQLAKGDVALSVGTMVLLMVTTVIYAPVVVPLVVEGATVDPLEIASSLVVLMLVPLGMGLLANARYPDFASSVVTQTGQASSVGLLLGIVAALLVSWQQVLSAVGSWVFVGVAAVVVTGLAFGYLAGLGGKPSHRPVLSLGTAQRNVAAAMVVAASLGGDVMVLTMVGALVIPIALIVVAGELGKRLPNDEAPAASSAESPAGPV